MLLPIGFFAGVIIAAYIQTQIIAPRQASSSYKAVSYNPARGYK
jgi:hypothetical protein